MSDNTNLHRAKENANDEFYTQLSDIENELKHYRSQFKDKVIFCNCDDPYESNFFKYFAMNFNFLGLKKLIATCYKSSTIANTELDTRDIFNFEIFDKQEKNHSYKVEITSVEDINGDGAVDLDDVEAMLHTSGIVQKLKGDGDFRSEECIELLKEADIVVTNPPFSLFREYVATLIKYKKQFIIIGNQNNVSTKETFNLIRQNKIWLGYHCGDMSFKVPSYYPEMTTRYWVDETGQKWRSLGNICWFTNIDIIKRHEEIILYKKYNPEEYPKYENYDAINVNKVADIPMDYEGVMGVPITFLDKYNPDQFEIIGHTHSADTSEEVEKLRLDSKKRHRGIIAGKQLYERILIRKKVQ